MQGIDALLQRWRTGWERTPEAVVPIPSRRRPQRVRALADHVAARLGVGVLDALDLRGPPPPEQVASLARAAALCDGLSVRGDVRIPPGSVVLVDDTYRTGWTMTVAGSILADAGVEAVYPLVLHKLP